MEDRQPFGSQKGHYLKQLPTLIRREGSLKDTPLPSCQAAFLKGSSHLARPWEADLPFLKAEVGLGACLEREMLTGILRSSPGPCLLNAALNEAFVPPSATGPHLNPARLLLGGADRAHQGQSQEFTQPPRCGMCVCVCVGGGSPTPCTPTPIALLFQSKFHGGKLEA